MYRERAKESESAEIGNRNVWTSIEIMVSSSRHTETGKPKAYVTTYGAPVLISNPASILWRFSVTGLPPDEDNYSSKLVW